MCTPQSDLGDHCSVSVPLGSDRTASCNMHIAFELVVLTGLAFAMKTGTDSFQSSERVQNQQ